MELMEVYHEAMATWIIARVTGGMCEGAKFVFDLIESAIRKKATEILLSPVQQLETVRVDFGRVHCYYRQPDITGAIAPPPPRDHAIPALRRNPTSLAQYPRLGHIVEPRCKAG
jgi:hypothetical protein